MLFQCVVTHNLDMCSAFSFSFFNFSFFFHDCKFFILKKESFTMVSCWNILRQKTPDSCFQQMIALENQQTKLGEIGHRYCGDVFIDHGKHRMMQRTAIMSAKHTFRSYPNMHRCDKEELHVPIWSYDGQKV